MKCYQCGTDFEGKFCAICGAPAGADQIQTPITKGTAYQYSDDKKFTSKPKKVKKPFYKKPIFIIIAALLVIGIVSSIVGAIKESIDSKFDWSDIELSEMLPAPKTNKGSIYDDTAELLYISLKKVSEKDFKSYVNSCKNEYGYTVDSVSDSDSYKAFNAEGYLLDITHYSDSMSLKLEAPVKFSKIQWPNSALGKLLPVPKSLSGSIEYEKDTDFSVKIGNTPIDAYNEYVAECMEKGFNVDYSKENREFYADNVDGYHVELNYIGNNIMDIKISAPDEEDAEKTVQKTTSATSTTTTAATTTKQPSKQSSNGIRPEFKKAMDKYEKAMNEYVDFMKKYKDSDGTDLGLLADYASYMNKYAEACDDFDEWDEDDLNNAELAYFIDVQARVNKKLLEIAD